ncbi:helix-turn-helix domain-containing protein [Staphylococcus caeli]|uniref:helix-turn-helix domain-containing protein n=1 Tax=Staphylococcus caeli TaxID=2201815 RepID=UPI003F573BA9
MFMTVKEVAQLLRINERHTYKLIQENEIPHIKLKGKILINKENLLQKLNKEAK